MPTIAVDTYQPWPELWGVMLFPDDQAKRRALAAVLGQGIYVKYRKAGFPRLPESTILSAMSAVSGAPLSQEECGRRQYFGELTGETLKLIASIAEVDPRRANWNTAKKLIGWHAGAVDAAHGKGRSSITKHLQLFKPVAHLWAAWSWRGGRYYEDPSNGYTALDDFHVFLTEAMALLNWARRFRHDRSGAKPVIGPEVASWIVPLTWEPPAAKPGWPRDGRLPAVALTAEWRARLNKRMPASV
jgi:hypothetical protein